MSVHCEIRLEYEDEAKARAIMESVRMDNEGFVDSKINGNVLVFRASSESAMSLSHTVNDLMACIKAAENSIM